MKGDGLQKKRKKKVFYAIVVFNCAWVFCLSSFGYYLFSNIIIYVIVYWKNIGKISNELFANLLL